MTLETLIVDEAGVVRRSSADQEGVRWDALAQVEIVTTDDRPFADDFFWLLTGDEDVTRLAVGGGVAEGVQLLPVLGARLPGLDHEAVIMACPSCVPARFLVWKDSRLADQSIGPPRAAGSAVPRTARPATAGKSAGGRSRLSSWGREAATAAQGDEVDGPSGDARCGVRIRRGPGRGRLARLTQSG